MIFLGRLDMQGVNIKYNHERIKRHLNISNGGSAQKLSSEVADSLLSFTHS